MTDERFLELCKFENEQAESGIKTIGGIDEAGRGPLAGPVVAACVVFNSEGPFPRADDSKKLSPKQRDKLYDEILETALTYGIGVIGPKVIDEINILQATYKAMQEAVRQCAVQPEILLVDYVKIPDIKIAQISITHGDALSVSIGAASIIAKVTRDRLMEDLSKEYPAYGFDKHKGYGTKAHYEALSKYGLTLVHRRSFLKNFEKQA
ncbi:MAG: ribonuclease HII [Clostridiales bacterium]|jgi:ribonuclease HII|nr:ribonuclease HII [Clostridiales bacterium]